MSRALVACLCAVAAGACSHEGTYDLTWTFLVAPPTQTAGAGGAGGGGATDDGAVSDDAAVTGDAAATDGAPTDDAGVLADGSVMDATAAPDAQPEAAGSGCGHHGVFAIRITGSSQEGSGEDVIATCTPGHFSHKVASGNWDFTVHALDARGNPKQPDQSAGGPTMLNPSASGVSISDGSTVQIAVTFVPQPECSDGVDNDHDGRVDLDDPDCAGNPDGNEE